MSLIADIKALFAAAKVAKVIESAPPVESTAMDVFFPEAVRQAYDSPLIPVSEISSRIGVVPVVARGGEPVPVSGLSQDITYIEPLPIFVEDELKGLDLNNLKLMNMGQREAWAARKVQRLRLTVKKTIEALCAQAAFAGAINHPLLVRGGGYMDYKVSFLSTITTVAVAAADKWDSAEATLVKVYQLLETMGTTLNRKGYPGRKLHYAGKDAYAHLLNLYDGSDKPKIPIQVGEGQVTIGGHVVKKMDEAYVNPATSEEVAKIPDKELRTVSQGYSQFFYAALDDLAAGLKALPMFVEAVEEKRPSRIVVTAQSKPLPVIAPGAVARATVVA